MDQQLIDLLVALHSQGQRQGPGSENTTVHALYMTGLDLSQNLQVADLGCGTGSQTITLAQYINGKIYAVDFLADFLHCLEDKLKQKDIKESIQAQIIPVCKSMDDLDFEPNSLDLIWSEGAIYNIGFAHGVEYFKKFLKPNGVLAVTELTFLTQDRPQELTDFWTAQYPAISTVSQRILDLENAKFKVCASFALSPACHLENYYDPLLANHSKFLAKFKDNPLAQEIVNLDLKEADLYRKYQQYFGYVFYIAKKLS